MLSSEKNTRKIIGNLIKKHRTAKDLTLQELATAMDADRQYIWKIENGHINITIDYLEKIISKLKCTHNDFFNE